MKYRLQLRAQAREEFLDALDWYADEDLDLATRFTTAVDEALAEVRDSPLKYARVHGEIRRALAQVFPYGVFFRVEEQTVIVLAIVHLARDPAIWKTR